jgi:hypothetical protein
VLTSSVFFTTLPSFPISAPLLVFLGKSVGHRAKLYPDLVVGRKTLSRRAARIAQGAFVPRGAPSERSSGGGPLASYRMRFAVCGVSVTILNKRTSESVHVEPPVPTKCPAGMFALVPTHCGAGPTLSRIGCSRWPEARVAPCCSNDRAPTPWPNRGAARQHTDRRGPHDDSGGVTCWRLAGRVRAVHGATVRGGLGSLRRRRARRRTSVPAGAAIWRWPRMCLLQPSSFVFHATGFRHRELPCSPTFRAPARRQALDDRRLFTRR